MNGIYILSAVLCIAQSLSVTSLSYLDIGTKREFDVNAVSYTDLLRPNNPSSVTTIETLRSTLTHEGIVSISDIPGLRELRLEMLTYQSLCAYEENLPQSTAVLQDGTVRQSFAAKVNRGNVEEFEESMFTSTSSSCVMFQMKAKSLRKLVQRVSLSFVSKLDSVCGTSMMLNQDFIAESSADHIDGYKSVASLISEGNSLEHFHTYNTKDTFGDSMSLDMHTDNGLFIAILPALFYKESIASEPQNTDDRDTTGFFIELPSGEIVEPKFVDDGNVLVFMIGEGVTTWINPKVATPLRPVPHGLVMPRGEDTFIRSWYGRMYLPPGDALSPISFNHKTFAEIRSENIKTLTTDKESSTTTTSTTAGDDNIFVACSPNMQLVHSSDDHGCKHNEMYCWMRCMPFDSDSCSAKEDYGACTNPQGEVWNKKDHCTTCTPKCLHKDLPPSKANDVCNGMITNMYMEGFVNTITDPEKPCLTIISDSFVLDSRKKYALGVVVVFSIGFLTELVIKLRRTLKKKLERSRYAIPVDIILFIIQVSVGYLAMLMAMTYSTVMFFAVVLGLAFGHVVFARNTPVGEHADPCCAYMEEYNSNTITLIDATSKPSCCNS